MSLSTSARLIGTRGSGCLAGKSKRPLESQSRHCDRLGFGRPSLSALKVCGRLRIIGAERKLAAANQKSHALQGSPSN